MKQIKLWEADPDKAYALQNSFPKEENGFVNAAYGLSREEFEEYVRRREANSRAAASGGLCAGYGLYSGK